MRVFPGIVLATLCAAVFPSRSTAQTTRGGEPPKDYSNSSVVTRMMAFDKNKDGKLTRDEITDERFLRLFDQADADRDGVVTREELMALAARLDAQGGQDGGRGGPGESDGPGRGGPSGRGAGGPPQAGVVLPPGLQNALNLTADQKKQLDDLQKEVDERLAKILTDEQKQQLKDLRGRGPGRFGPPGGPGSGPDRRPPERP